MFNYEDLCDVEFEALAQDVMSKKLGVELKRFAKGTDGGVDLTNNAQSRDIIVQVKHYYRSSISSLLSSLKKEIINVETNKPQKYYVVTTATLSADKKVEIFSMFRGYMDDVNNVITREDIEDLLQGEDYIGVVKKHFKLWLHSTNILDLVFNAEIEQDSIVCITRIKENEKVLVQTQAYFEAMRCLESSRILFLTGAPGVGKTITAQMLVLKYISEGYRLRFSTDTTDLNALKKSLSLNRETQEVILLDDCLGQYYFKMKSTQDSELISLIKLVKVSPNKILILNSRLTILNEAKSLCRDLEKCLDSEDLHIHIIDMNRMRILDKAKILYNHLFFSSLPNEYFVAVKENNFYRDIISHKNYTPRIIEYITSSRNYTLVSYNNYPQFILGVLNCPNEIWDNEYSQRIQQVDRIFLSTLYSLTDTLVDAELLQKCFYFRIQQTSEIDQTVDNFRNCLTRLNMSMVRVVDDHGRMKIGVLNPSVNDYLANRLMRNDPEREAIIKSICSVEQAKKMLPACNDYISGKLMDKTILNFYFTSTIVKEDFLLASICEYEICDEAYASIVTGYLHKIRVLCDSKGHRIIPEIMLLDRLLNSNLYTYYEVPNILKEHDVLLELLNWYEFDDLIPVICLFSKKFSEENDMLLLSLLNENCTEALVSAIEFHGFNVDISEETEQYDINQIIEANIDVDYETGEREVDIEGAALDLRREYEHDLRGKISEMLTALPVSIRGNIPDEWNISFPRSDFEDVIRAALEPDIDDYEEHAPSIDVMMEEIDYMFQR